MSSIRQKIHQMLYYYVHVLISKYLPRDRQGMLTCVNNNTVLFYTPVLFLFTFESIHLKYIKYPQSGKKLSLEYQKIFDDMFSDLKSVHTLHVFWFRNWFIYFFFSYVEIVNFLRRREGVGIYFKLIPGWIKSTPDTILFTDHYITKFEILPG